MYSSEYVPTLENDEQERINNIKKHLAKKDLNYLYHEFDFEENEDIVDAFFDEEDRLHIIYNTTEPEDLTDEDLIDCADGVKRTKQEYDLWISNLMNLYEMESGDLTDVEKQALIDGGFIDDERYTEEALDIYEKVQLAMNDEDRIRCWREYSASVGEEIPDEHVTMNDFWDWFEGLDSDEIETFDSFITELEK